MRFSRCSLARTLPCCLRHSVQVCLRRMPLDRVLLIGNCPSCLIWWQTLHSRWSWWPCQCAFNMVLVLTWWLVWAVAGGSAPELGVLGIRPSVGAGGRPSGRRLPATRRRRPASAASPLRSSKLPAYLYSIVG